MNTRQWAICTLILLALPGIASAYQGVVITAKYKPVTGGYRYYLTVNNDTNPADSLYVQFFATQLTPATDLVVPTTNWSAQVFLSYYAEWTTGPSWMSWPKGIAPGQTLTGFAFTSTKLSTQIRYFGSLARDDGSTMFNNYIYPEAMPVPEPSSLLAITTGLGVLGLCRSRKRPRT